jgi:nitroimidazol reductase NimA-like FMN-containing flavoprotein (pyridoxamine 5'-phosphate oxidase superfamily)
MSDFDTAAVAARLVGSNRYMTIATADADGTPWVSPVWYAAASDTEFLWVSSPTARHSRNITARPQIAIVIFDSTVPETAAEALYLEATARELADDQVPEAIAAYSARSQACGNPVWTVKDVVPPSRFRLYCATAMTRSVLGPGDQRLPVTTPQ